jgi:hypothetical protein
MPTIAPIDPKIIEEIEKTSDPHKLGINPPIEDPIIIPIQTKAFEFIYKIIS